jgi:hypothetical protein
VHCTDCHSASHANPLVALHLDNTGISVACVGCHAFGLARDFMFASGAPVDNSTGAERKGKNNVFARFACFAVQYEKMNPCKL